MHTGKDFFLMLSFLYQILLQCKASLIEAEAVPRGVECAEGHCGQLLGCWVMRIGRCSGKWKYFLECGFPSKGMLQCKASLIAAKRKRIFNNIQPISVGA